MKVVRSRSGLQAWADAERRAGRRIALVPTLGALHAGHLALVRDARKRADRVVVSVFVNPTQFGPGEDLSRYPRPLEADLDACRAARVDVVFLPAEGELYPDGSQTWVEVSELSKPLCGRTRPGHFRGVATIVTKLLIAAKPHVACFGEKDYQQLLVVRRLVRDLGLDVEIVALPIVRDADGVALSSRNAYLDAGSRHQARVLVKALDAAERACAAGESRSGALLEIVARELEKAPQGHVEYAELLDAETLDPAPAVLRHPTLLALAVRFAGARLIDNRVLTPQEDPS